MICHLAEFEYEYMTTEHIDSRQSVRMQHGKRSSKRDVLQVEYRLIEYPGWWHGAKCLINTFNVDD